MSTVDNFWGINLKGKGDASLLNRELGVFNRQCYYWIIPRLPRFLLSQSYYYYFKKKYGWTGHFWQNKFKSKPVGKDEYFIQLIKKTYNKYGEAIAKDIWKNEK